MTQFRPPVTRVKGLSDRRRLPLLGRVRLGIKKKSPNTGNEYPVETDYFVCPHEVQAAFGEQPKSLKIMIPINDIDSVFPTSYTFYGSSKGVKCKGDGEQAWFVNDAGEMDSKPCPCDLLEHGKCKQIGRLLFMIPSVSVGGVYQLSTSSYNSIIDIQSGLDFVQAMVGRFSMIELELRREPTETHFDGKKQTHYTCRLSLPKDFNVNDLQQLQLSGQQQIYSKQLALPEPVEENPEYDAVDVIDSDEINDMEKDHNAENDWLEGLERENPQEQEKITQPQIKKLFAVLTQYGAKSDQEKKDYINAWLEANNRPPVTTRKDITKTDAMLMIDELEKTING